MYERDVDVDVGVRAQRQHKCNDVQRDDDGGRYGRHDKTGEGSVDLWMYVACDYSASTLEAHQSFLYFDGRGDVGRLPIGGQAVEGV